MTMEKENIEYIYFKEDLEKCPICEKKKLTKKQKLKEGFLAVSLLIVVILAIFGAIYVYMFLLRLDYFMLPFNAIQSTLLTRQSYEDNPMIENQSQKIIEYCENETDEKLENYIDVSLTAFKEYPDISILDRLEREWMEECKIERTLSFIQDFSYVGDFSYGYADFTVNMIVENSTKGDCDDFALTFCSLLNNMDISCKVVVTKNHAMVVIQRGNIWIPYDPQTGEYGYFRQSYFSGYMV